MEMLEVPITQMQIQQADPFGNIGNAIAMHT